MKPDERSNYMDFPVVLVTGASSGIGLELTRALWNLNYRVVVTYREESAKFLLGEPFEDSERFLMRPLNVTDYDSIETLVDDVSTIWGGVDILINNAGISYRSVVEEMTQKDEEYQMSVNYFGPLALIRSVVPLMRKKGSGQIINVSSVGGMMAMPTMASYSASKFALEGATEALWYEMKPWNIKVSLIQPGFINSDSFRKVLFSNKRKNQQASDYEIYYEKMGHFVETFMERSFSNSQNVANLILKVMKTPEPRLRYPATWDAWVFRIFRRLIPHRVYHKILYQSLPDVGQWKSSDG